jgi:arylsulfatase A-like enzyme
MSNRKVSNPSVSIMDLAPTILSLLGVEVPDGYDGKVLEFSAPFGQGGN